MAPSVVQTKSSSTTSGATLPVTLTSTAAQNTLIVCIGDNAIGNNATSVVTSGGQNLVNAIVETDSAGSTAEIWYLDNVPAGQTSVTVNWASSAPSHANAVAYEVNGVYAAGGSLDKTSGNFADTGSPTSWTSSATATLSQASEIAIGSSAQVGVGISATGPSSPWTNTIINSNGGIAAGYNIVSATTGLAYAGSTTHSGTAHTSTAIATFKAGTPPPANAPSTFYPPKAGRGQSATRRGTSTAGPGAAYVDFPSKFHARHKPAKGAAAAVKGRSTAEPGAAYVDFPSTFYAPHKPAKGASGATRGTSRSSPGAKYIHVIPPGPAPFTPPTGPAKGRSAIVRGLSRSSPGAPYFHVSVFTLPTAPASGASATRRGTTSASAGAKWVAVTHPSAFYPPHGPAKGASAAVRGRGLGHVGARFVLIRVSPFYAPHGPAKGTSAIRRGTGRGSITGHGSPQVPRQLIITLAAKAGTDDYGNAYPQGILATEGIIEGPTLIGSDAFFYSSKTLGGLAQSITEADGTDQYGNAYLAGTATYTDNGSFWSAVVVADGVVTWYEASGPGGPWTSEAGIGFSWNSSTGGGLIFTGVAGNSMTGDLNVTGSITASVTLTVSGTDVGSTLNAIISALSGASTSNNGIANGTITGTSGGASTGTAHTHGGGSYSVTDGHHSHTLPTV